MSQMRREFIKTAIAASVASSLGIWVPPEARAQAKAATGEGPGSGTSPYVGSAEPAAGS